MTIVNTLDEVAAWLDRNVCQQIKLKPQSFDKQTKDFEYRLVTPAVFPLYVPTSSTKPPRVRATSPSICVQLVKGTDDPFKQSRSVRLRLAFSVWTPGIHGPDVFAPTDEVSSTFGRSYERGKDGTFRPSNDGWRDVWNFVDVALRAIESTRDLGGHALDPSSSIEWGTFEEALELAGFYPFWFAWVELGIQADIVTTFTDSDYNNLLY